SPVWSGQKCLCGTTNVLVLVGKSEKWSATEACCVRPALVDTVALTGPELPVGVCGLPDPPDRLFLTGVMPAGPRVAIVGTRRPTDAAQKFAEQLAFELSAAGIVVVSGGALGIDAAAHRGAM